MGTNLLLWSFMALLGCGFSYDKWAGKEFALTFMENYQANYGNPHFQVTIVALGADSKVTVRVATLKFVKEQMLKAGEGITVMLPLGVEMYGSRRSLHTVLIEASADVTVSSLNSKDLTADTSVVYPVTAWGTEYYIFTPNGSPFGSFKEFALTNGKEKNKVEIFLRGPVLFDNQWTMADGLLVMDLQPYESIQLQSLLDLSGSRVSSQQPIAVISGHTCTWKFSKCNHVYEQLLPVKSWGTNFMLPPMVNQNNYDSVFIQASQQTQVTVQNGNSVDTLKLTGGQSLEVKLQQPNTIYLKADHGIQVLLLFNGVQLSFGNWYDPFLMTVLPTDRFCSSYSLEGQNGFINNALLVVKSSDIAGLRFDSNSMPSTVKWAKVTGTEFSWADMSYQPDKIHTVSHPSSSFGLYSTGVGQMNGYGAPSLCTNTGTGQACDNIGGVSTCVKPSTGLCWASGDPHYHTFDGRNFDFMGTCTYVMSKSCAASDSLPAFEVQTRNENRGSLRVSYVGLVTVKVYDLTITAVRSEIGRVRIGNGLWCLPVVLNAGKVNLTQSGRYVLIQTDFGLTVQYDWQHHIVVTLSSSYAGKACGLCGNFNGNPNDDFSTPTGAQAGSSLAFGTNWKVPGLVKDAKCIDECVGGCDRCDGNLLGLWGGQTFCGLLTLVVAGPFAKCHSSVDPSAYFENCKYDVCMGGGLKEVLCRALEAYTDACQRANIQVLDWRAIALCPAKCPANSHYELCGSACPATCSDPASPTKCKLPCVETCTCNSGFVLSGGQCVPATQCGCTYQGYNIPTGQSFWADQVCRSRCMCNAAGRVECKDSGCGTGQACQVVNGIRDCFPVSDSTCRATGDPHYLTFDQKKYDFQGTCVYQMAALCSKNPDLVPFEVRVQNNNRGNKVVAFTKLVEVKVYSLSIIISQQNPGLIMVNGELVNLPISLSDGQLSVYKSGWTAVVTTTFGLKVTFDWNSAVFVTLPSTYMGSVCGLCGNYNGQAQDDLIPKNGSQPVLPLDFGTSWRVEEIPGCVNGCKGTCPDCDVTQKRQYETNEFCGLLRDPAGPFRECYAKVDPGAYFDDCVFDVCLYKGKKEIVCQAVTAYMSACQAMGVNVYSWRTPLYCEVKCSANSHYEVCGSGCPATCQSLSSAQVCQSLCKEGCSCDEGYILSGDACVSIAQCGCLFADRYYQSGQVFYPNGKCEQVCTCTKSGTVECKAFSCGPNEKCEISNGVQKCNPVGTGVCNAAGDPHYLSFDGRPFDFQGTCTYTLAKACGLEGTNLVVFSVQVENEPWIQNKKVSVTRLVALEVYGITLILRNGMFGVLVNGVFNNLPMSLNNGAVKVYKQGLKYVMSTDFGLLLTYDLVYHVSVTVPGNYRGKTCGLCGNFNGDLKDDFRLPSQQVTDKIAVFGESWKVAIPGVVCDNGCEGNNCPACLPAQRAVFEKPTHCGIVKLPTGPFSACHSKLDPMPFFNNCIFDVCVSQGDEKILCDSVSAYAFNCHMAGVDIKNWRTPSFCPLMCPANSHYEVCADDCFSACPGLSSIVQCSTSCTEGCECDAGFFFDGQNCVKEEQCGCYGNGRTYMPGEMVYEGDCDKKCSCSTKGLVCEAYTCPKDTKCLVKNGVKDCYNTDPCKDAKCRVKETCKVTKDKAVCVPQYTGTCWAWGDPHYHTFDGYNYDYQGTCKYTISKTSGNLDGLVPFSVSEKNENRGNTAVSYVREVEVTVYDFTISIVKQQIGTVMVNGELRNLPVLLGEGQVTLTQYGASALVETDFGLRVSYDWNWLVLIQLPSTYYGLVAGLCGNFNGNVGDELQDAAGTMVSSVMLWGKAWRVPGQTGDCADTCQNCPVCDSNQRKPYQSNELCGALTDKSTGLFQTCQAKVDPQSFFDSCVYDMCMNKGDRKLLCQALASYSERCRDQGIVVQKWRQKYGCPLNCQPNSHYDDCASPCQPFCPFPDKPAVCTLNCVESCVCDKGYILSAGVCVPANTCGCSYQGRYYTAGQRFWTSRDCNRLCECDTTLGIVICQEASCSASEKCSLVDGEPTCQPVSSSSCTAAGDPHYNTFDGRRFDFQGTCEYLLVSLVSQKPGLQPFRVTVQNDHRGNNAVAFTKTVTLTIYNVSITLSRNYPFKVMLLGQLTSLPLNYNGQLSASLSGRSVVLETDAGITVTFDWQSVVTVTLPSTYQGSVGGLCGNYNGNPQDDMTMRNGSINSDATKLGNSWLVALVPGCVSGCQGAACQGCSESQRQVYMGPAYCGLIADKAGPFKECRDRLDPAPFLENCLYDACQYQGHQGTVCDAVATYVSACQGLGVNIPPWRSLVFCPMTCPTNSHYGLCVPGCPSTCAGFSPATTCKRPCAEGCACDEGFVWSGSACAPVADCGCSYGGRYYKQGEVFYTDVMCLQKCSCGLNGAVSCQQAKCGPGETCKVVNGVQGCLPEGQAKCVASGDPHYITFDGRRFDFQGNCVYTLAKVVNSDKDQLTSFTVTQANEKYGNGKVSVTKTVTVEVLGSSVRIVQGMAWRVLVNGELMNLPLLLNEGRIAVNQQGKSIVLQTDFGLRVLYDTAYYVEVIVPSTYRDKMRGLCGNYNKNAADDFMLPTGLLTTEEQDFGKAWGIDQPGSVCGGCGSQCPVCGPDKAAVYSKPDSCGIMSAAQGLFDACKSVVNPNPYVDHCVYDVCAMEGDKETLCMSIQAYVLACQDAGIQVKAWRTSSFCPVTCPANSHYELCADTCANTCASLIDGRFTCSDRCYEGCQCDAGFISDGVICVRMDTCGCVYDDKYLKLGQSVLNKDCSSKCVCQAPGVVKCETLACTSEQVCAVKGGIRACYGIEGNCLVNSNALLTTFDGLAGPMGVVGAFELASFFDQTSADWFRVVVDLRVCNKLPGTASVAIVYMYFNNVTIAVNSQQFTWVNGKKVLLPSMLGNQLSVQIIDNAVVVERASSVRITYSISQELSVTVGLNLANKVRGACGNFNNNAQDDLKTADGGVATTVSVVVGSWRAGDFSSCGL